MLDYDHLFDDYNYSLDKFCEMFDVKLRPYQKKLIWLSTMIPDSHVLISCRSQQTKSYGTRCSGFIIDETLYDDKNWQ